MHTQNHQELSSQRTQNYRGQSVLMDFLIIKPLRSEFYSENIKLFH